MAREAAMPRTVSGRLVEAGSLPPWEVAELPAPPAYNLKNALRVTGAGAIILGISIGSGEWLIGPAVTAQFTAALLWVTTGSRCSTDSVRPRRATRLRLATSSKTTGRRLVRAVNHRGL